MVSGSVTGKGRSATTLNAEKAATVAPMPIESTSTAVAVNPGEDRIARNV